MKGSCVYTICIYTNVCCYDLRVHVCIIYLLRKSIYTCLQGYAADIDNGGGQVTCFDLFMRLMNEDKLVTHTLYCSTQCGFVYYNGCALWLGEL